MPDTKKEVKETQMGNGQANSSAWYSHAYRRNVVDMHIPDWHESFLSQFDPKAYVQTLKISRAQSAVLYAHSHAGLTYYPTKYGQMHRGLNGRSIFAETAEECHTNGIAVQLYFSLIYDTWAYRTHPDWRIRRADGSGVGDESRYGVCCPNSPYREHVERMVAEICQEQQFDGIRFDMTFWPTVCYCIHCRKRFHQEVGGELPTTVNWNDPTWVAFQRKREEWLTEFAGIATSTVKKYRPDASIEHQSSTYSLSWRFGVAWHLAQHNTFLQGDFYGDILQGSVARKMFYNLTPERPFGFETSFCVSLNNHTAKKNFDWLRCKTYAAIADGGAFVFIDAIDPAGTLNPRTYECMGRIFGETEGYDPYLGGKRLQEIGVYLSTESKYSLRENGLRLIGDDSAATNQEVAPSMPHVDGLYYASEALIHNHLPYGVLTRKNLDDLGKFKIVILPNVLMMSAEEVEAIRRYVADGGCVYASKYTSLQRSDGVKPGDFMLGDVFGVSYVGETPESFTFLAPVKDKEEFFDTYTESWPMGIAESQIRVQVNPGAEVWATLVLPYSDPSDYEHFASIHSNPPGIWTGEPALVMNRYGKGKAIYCAAPIETPRMFGDIFVNLLRTLCNDFAFEASAPPCIEVTAFDQSEHHRIIVCLLNFQKDLPNVPVNGVRVSVRMDGRAVQRIFVAPQGEELECTEHEGRVCVESPEVENFQMMVIEYH